MSDKILLRLCDGKHWSKNNKKMSVKLEKVQVKNEGTLNINCLVSLWLLSWPPFDPKWWWLGYLIILQIFSFLFLDL